MVITHLGHQCFKIQVGDLIIATNPISKESKLKSSRFGADICLVTTDNVDFNGVDMVNHGDRSPFVISSPGEYEVQNVFIKGLTSTSGYDGKTLLNTVYTFTLDSISICFLGAVNAPLPAETRGKIDEVDILFVPIGGNGTLEPHDAYKMAVTFEPKMIIPMGYGVHQKDALKTFQSEGSEGGEKPVDKLTIKRKDLEGKDGDIIVFESVI